MSVGHSHSVVTLKNGLKLVPSFSKSSNLYFKTTFAFYFKRVSIDPTAPYEMYWVGFRTFVTSHSQSIRIVVCVQVALY